MPKKLLFISSSNLTTNPRLAKELKFAVEQGYDVDFVGFKLGGWSDEVEKKTIKDLNADFFYLSAVRKPFLTWFVSSLAEKLSKIIYSFSKNIPKITAYAHSKRSFLLKRHLQSLKINYDLIVAHTLPTLYPAYKLAKKQKIPFIFDIEDYHPGEQSALAEKHEKKRREFLMSKLLPQASFITYASPLIGEYSLKLLKEQYPDDRHTLINNCFSEKEFQYEENNSEKVKFVWFSQNIAQGRGLELIIPELAKFKDKIELTLIGNLYSDFYDDFLKNYEEFIRIIPPLPQKELNLKLSEFDIGLAIEPGKDFNNMIALSNKIWAYFQAGLYIFATKTKAQALFIQEHGEHGILALPEINDLNRKIVTILQKIDQIRHLKKQRFEAAKDFSWEKESEKLTEIWNSIL